MLIGGLQKTSLIDYPDKICSTIFTMGCNFKCPYCHNPELVNRTATPIPEEEVFEFLRKREKVLEGVCITGGEPTMQQDLPKFAKKIKSIGLLVKLDTNGSNQKMLSKMINEKLVDYIAMDIKGPLDKYSKIVGVDVDKHAIEKSVKLIRNSKIDYEFRTTVVPDLVSKDDIVKIGKWLKGSKRYHLQKFRPAKVLDKTFEEKTCTSQELESYMLIVRKYFESCGIRND